MNHPVNNHLIRSCAVLLKREKILNTTNTLRQRSKCTIVKGLRLRSEGSHKIDFNVLCALNLKNRIIPPATTNLIFILNDIFIYKEVYSILK